MGTRMEQRRGTSAEWNAANTILGDGEIGYNKTTGEFKIGDGVTAWSALTQVYIRKSDMDALYVARALVTAAGDLLVGSGAGAIVRLGKGADGQYLSVVGGVLTWNNVDLSSRVAKSGDTMSGALNAPQVNATGAGLFDNGNRAYSASNPPPGVGGAASVAVVTTNYAVAGPIAYVFATNAITVTLPAAATNAGRRIDVKNNGTSTVTLASAGGTIDGSTSVALSTQYMSITVVSDGTNWNII